MEILITPETLPYIIYGAGAILLVVLALLIRAEIRLARLLKGKSAKTLEDTLTTLGKEIEGLQEFKKVASEKLSQAEKELNESIQGVGVVRFTPFKGTSGSNQSFAAAFLTKDGNGVVVTSIYSREHVSVFAKPVEKKNSEYGLTPEEKQAIEKALTK